METDNRPSKLPSNHMTVDDAPSVPGFPRVSSVSRQRLTPCAAGVACRLAETLPLERDLPESLGVLDALADASASSPLAHSVDELFSGSASGLRDVRR